MLPAELTNMMADRYIGFDRRLSRSDITDPG
jgi:hypothetical protein